MEKIYFTLDEATALLPFLSDSLSQIQKIKQEIVHLVRQLESNGENVETIFHGTELPPEKMQYKQKLEELGDRITSYLDDIQERGVIVKDIDQGLVDFYARINDEDAFLCWKMGEAEIQHWHGINEGFSGRKSLFTKDVLANVTVLH